MEKIHDSLPQWTVSARAGPTVTPTDTGYHNCLYQLPNPERPLSIAAAILLLAISAIVSLALPCSLLVDEQARRLQ